MVVQARKLQVIVFSETCCPNTTPVWNYRVSAPLLWIDSGTSSRDRLTVTPTK